MNKKLLLIIIILLGNNIMNGQNSKFVTHLFSGDTIYSNQIEYVTKSFSNSYFLIDGKKIASNGVKFYQNELGFFGNLKNLSFSGSTSFVKREKEGNINLFKRDSYSSTNIISSNGMMMGSTEGRFINYYYNLNKFGDLKKANYRNLKIDLYKNPNSMFHLKKYKSATLRETLLYIAGAGILVTGVASLISNTSNVPDGESPKMGGSFVIIGVGFGTLVTNYLTSLNKGKHIERAIEAYN